MKGERTKEEQKNEKEERKTNDRLRTFCCGLGHRISSKIPLESYQDKENVWWWISCLQTGNLGECLKGEMESMQEKGSSPSEYFGKCELT